MEKTEYMIIVLNWEPLQSINKQLLTAVKWGEVKTVTSDKNRN
jgi:hypothetical protein